MAIFVRHTEQGAYSRVSWMSRIFVVILSVVLGSLIAGTVAHLFLEFTPLIEAHFWNPFHRGMMYAYLLGWNILLGGISGGIAGGVPRIGWRGIAGTLGAILLVFAMLCAIGTLWDLIPFLLLLIAVAQIPALSLGWALNRLCQRKSTNEEV